MQMLKKISLAWDNMGTLKYKLKSKRLCSLKWCVKEAALKTLSQAPIQFQFPQRHAK